MSQVTGALLVGRWLEAFVPYGCDEPLILPTTNGQRRFSVTSVP
jgi:hypothetical protein